MTHPSDARRDEQRIIVNVTLSVPASRIADDLASAGLDVRQVLDALGIVNGTVAASNIARVRAVDGVLDVEEDREVEARPWGSGRPAPPQPARPGPTAPAARPEADEHAPWSIDYPGRRR